MVVKKSSMVAGIASERVEILFDLAKKAYGSDPELSRKYVRIIRKIAAHYRLRLGQWYKGSFCRKCNTVFIPGKTCTIRLVGGKRYKAIRCLDCGSETHVHYRPRTAIR